jgi:multicomponent Na+:H+ antiporter subunit G
MPDLYARMQATTKGITLGLMLLVVGAGLHFASVPTWTRGLMVVAFVFITSPVAAHMIAKASHKVGIRQNDRAIGDDLADQDPERG